MNDCTFTAKAQSLILILFNCLSLGLLAGPDESLYAKGRTLLITGGVGAIGREVAKKALECSNRVIICA